MVNVAHGNWELVHRFMATPSQNRALTPKTPPTESTATRYQVSTNRISAIVSFGVRMLRDLQGTASAWSSKGLNGFEARSGSPEPDWYIHGFAIADDRDADGRTRLMFFDFGQELFDGSHSFVLDGDDQIGRFVVE
jgi:hypothetical protein